MCVIFHAAIENSRRLIQIENQSHVFEDSNIFHFINEQLPLDADKLFKFKSNLHANQSVARVRFSCANFLLIRKWFMKWHRELWTPNALSLSFLHTQKFIFFLLFMPYAIDFNKLFMRADIAKRLSTKKYKVEMKKKLHKLISFILRFHFSSFNWWSSALLN